ncbi:MAG: hypothetical protein ACLTMP_00750 [Eggerthella lenta]
MTDANWGRVPVAPRVRPRDDAPQLDYMVEEVRENMANYKTGKDGFDVRLLPLRQRVLHGVRCRHA